MVARSRMFTAVLAVTVVLVSGCGGEEHPAPTGTVKLAVIAGAEHGGAPFARQLTQEVTTTPVWQGDADGTGEALITVNPGRGEICWRTHVSNIALPATASHIHNAPVNIRGDIVVFLSPPDATGIVTGCRSGLDAGLLRDILARPDSYYVNVHTSEYPAGAIRGQLGR